MLTSQEEDFSQWYIDLILKAKLADYAPVKGCMVIRPAGMRIWESIQHYLDQKFSEENVDNAYFPMLLPESFLNKEKEHVEGFKPELALVQTAGGQKLNEAYVLRPTSETMIWAMFSQWIHSYRDLPLKLNQWANVVRWEKRTRLFLRTSEFLWQEGHTAHTSGEQAQQQTIKMLHIYQQLLEQHLAIPVYVGKKTEAEKFAGAVETYSLEVLLQDKKALQAGTSHYLGQNFAKAFQVRYQDENEQMQYVWASSWGVSTRLIGALILTHSDNKGLVLPPSLAKIQVRVVPITNKENRNRIFDQIQKLRPQLDQSCRWEIDQTDQSPGWKFAQSELDGIPIRLELGQKDLGKNQFMAVIRDTGEKIPIEYDQIEQKLPLLLEQMQQRLYQKALAFQQENTQWVDAPQQIQQIFPEFECTGPSMEGKQNISDSSIDEVDPSQKGGGGFLLMPWCGRSKCEAKLKEAALTIRCLPQLWQEQSYFSEHPHCAICGGKTQNIALVAKAY